MNCGFLRCRAVEALLLNAYGRFRLPANLADWLAQATAPLRETPFTHEVVLLAQQLPLPIAIRPIDFWRPRRRVLV